MAYIYWAKCKCNGGKNFGDMITQYLYKKITGKDCIYCNNKKIDAPVYFGAGSIMSASTGWKNLTVWGTGIMFKNARFKRPTTVLSVRGPLTRKRFLELGYSCPENYGDIGLLLPRFYKPNLEKKYKLGIIPHYIDYTLCQKMYNDDETVIVIDLTENIEDVIDNILKCDATISSSLHGIITSHAYDIKSAWGRFSNKIAGGDTKYLDYYSSVGITNKLQPIPIFQKININDLLDEIERYDNPKFPIETEHIMKLCPFS